VVKERTDGCGSGREAALAGEELEGGGYVSAAGAGGEGPEERIADMDSLGVEIQVLSPYVGLYNYQLDAATAAATSRALNDEIAGMTRTSPQRFAGLVAHARRQGPDRRTRAR
jgi:hypothetical protein